MLSNQSIYPTQEFMAVIVECSFELHATLLNRAFIIFGVKKSMVHEHVSLLQCGKCWRYGHHTGARCPSEKSICKKCTQNHVTSECTATTRINSCINCIEANKKGTHVKTDHLPNDDRCKIRIARINGLKEHL